MVYFFFVRRFLKGQFQQTLIGVLWIALQSIIQMLVFYVILGVLVPVQTVDISFPVFFLTGFVVWLLFFQVVNASAFSLLGNVGIITKPYFPCLALSLSKTLRALVDFTVCFGIFLVLLTTNQYAITAPFLHLPVLLIFTFLFSSGIGMLFDALMIVFGDTKKSSRHYSEDLDVHCNRHLLECPAIK